MHSAHHVSVSPITLESVVEMVEICFSLQNRGDLERSVMADYSLNPVTP